MVIPSESCPSEELNRTHYHRILTGTARIFTSEALVIPAGLLLAAYLSRKFELGGYGLWILASTVVIWIELTIVALLAGSSVKAVAEAGSEWPTVADTVVWLHALVGTFAGLALFVFAEPLARMLSEPALVRLLKLFAFDVPLFALGLAHRCVLSALGNFHCRLRLNLAKWGGRLALTVMCVEAGFSIEGAVLATVAATLLEAAVARGYVRPGCRRSGPALGRLVSLAAPLFISALSMRVFDRLDLFMLMRLGGSPEDAGLYGAAVSLASLPALFAASLGPVLFNSLTQQIRSGQGEAARRTAGSALRLGAWMLAVSGAVAGAAPEVTRLMFGPAFLGAARPLTLLIVAAAALMIFSLAHSILLAMDKHAWLPLLSLPVAIIAVPLHLFLIPEWGGTGAAAGTLASCFIGAIASLVIVRGACVIPIPAGSLLRGAAVGALIFELGRRFPASGAWVSVKLAAVTAAVPLGLALAGEFTRADASLARSLLARKP